MLSLQIFLVLQKKKKVSGDRHIKHLPVSVSVSEEHVLKHPYKKICCHLLDKTDPSSVSPISAQFHMYITFSSYTGSVTEE